MYLNQIFLGLNSYGVTAASQSYFNKPLDELAIEEAAYLAALPKAPSRYHPVRAEGTAIERRNFVINEMVENGFVGADDGEIAKASELQTVLGGHFDFISFCIAEAQLFHRRDFGGNCPIPSARMSSSPAA